MSVGDMVFVDAGTVHAIGPGVVLLETQQTSDMTYPAVRLWAAAGAASGAGVEGDRSTKTAAGKVAPKKMDGFTRLIEQKYFVVDRFDLDEMEERRVAMDGAGCLVGLKGSGGDYSGG